jgi:hypothetical protein
LDPAALRRAWRATCAAGLFGWFYVNELRRLLSELQKNSGETDMNLLKAKGIFLRGV